VGEVFNENMILTCAIKGNDYSGRSPFETLTFFKLNEMNSLIILNVLCDTMHTILGEKENGIHLFAIIIIMSLNLII